MYMHIYVYVYIHRSANLCVMESRCSSVVRQTAVGPIAPLTYQILRRTPKYPFFSGPEAKARQGKLKPRSSACGGLRQVAPDETAAEETTDGIDQVRR